MIGRPQAEYLVSQQRLREWETAEIDDPNETKSWLIKTLIKHKVVSIISPYLVFPLSMLHSGHSDCCCHIEASNDRTAHQMENKMNKWVSRLKILWMLQKKPHIERFHSCAFFIGKSYWKTHIIHHSYVVHSESVHYWLIKNLLWCVFLIECIHRQTGETSKCQEKRSGSRQIMAAGGRVRYVQIWSEIYLLGW